MDPVGGDVEDLALADDGVDRGGLGGEKWSRASAGSDQSVVLWRKEGCLRSAMSWREEQEEGGVRM